MQLKTREELEALTLQELLDYLFTIANVFVLHKDHVNPVWTVQASVITIDAAVNYTVSTQGSVPEEALIDAILKVEEIHAESNQNVKEST